jgi:hypothetical protein
VIADPIGSAVPVIAFLLVEYRAIRLHSRLRPWCPYCRGGGGWDDPEQAPEPPDGHGLPVPRESAITGGRLRG